MSFHAEPPSYIPPHPTLLDCHRAPVWLPWVIQQILSGSFTYGIVSFHVTLSIHLILSLLPPAVSISLLSMSVSSLLPWKKIHQCHLSRFHIYVLKVKVKSLSRVWLFVTLWTVAHQAPPSMGFSRQEYWSGLPFPSPGDLSDPGIKPRSPALQAGALTSEPPGLVHHIYLSLSDLLHSVQ